MTEAATPKLLRTLAGETFERPPVWFMRQAGRSLPEYRELRTRAKDFLAFCYDPEMAAEATLQPMRRFPFDAAIVFADILLIPQALGQEVWFEAGEGPRLGALPEVEALAGEVEASTARLASIGETLSRVRAQLEPERALIGFAGAPWTVATYMIEGRGSDRSAARAFAYEQAERLDQILEILVEATARYLVMQARRGAQVLKLFESWADQVPVQAVGLDTQASLAQGRRIQAGGKAIEGALDNLLLRVGGPDMDRRIDTLIEAWSPGPYIFNLGHGVLPDTPVAHIERAVRRITGK